VNSSKLGLGTAQWGLPYGIANRTGRPAPEDVLQILEKAQRFEISMLDTAHSYGEAESVLGSLGAVSKGFRVFTKTIQLRAPAITENHIGLVRDAFLESLRRLCCSHASGLLVHYVQDLMVPGGERLWELLESLRRDSLVERIGVSVYHPREAEYIVKRFDIDVIQVPLNIYDQRFIQSGLLSGLKQAGIEVHARSAFLQGLLLLPAEKLPQHFDSIREHHARLHRFLADSGAGPLDAALQFCLSRQDVDHVVVGCETLPQLEEIIAITERGSPPLAFSDFALSDEAILDPSQWNN
jgi:aryl-alcohol dehydrogenase-like predicted oxidoreductase